MRKLMKRKTFTTVVFLLPQECLSYQAGHTSKCPNAFRARVTVCPNSLLKHTKRSNELTSVAPYFAFDGGCFRPHPYFVPDLRSTLSLARASRPASPLGVRHRCVRFSLFISPMTLSREPRMLLLCWRDYYVVHTRSSFLRCWWR